MPLYEYQCESCEHRFEVIQKFSDPSVGTCPKCGGVVRRLLSSPAIQFKGTGWYITDYAKKSGTPAASTSGEGASSSSASDSRVLQARVDEDRRVPPQSDLLDAREERLTGGAGFDVPDAEPAERVGPDHGCSPRSERL